MYAADNGAESRDTLALTSRTESSSATWSTKSWTPSVKRTINWRGGIGPPLLDTSSGMGSARCLPLAFSLRGCICCKLSQKAQVRSTARHLLRNTYLRSTADAKNDCGRPRLTAMRVKKQRQGLFNKLMCRMQRLSSSSKVVHPEDSRSPGPNAMLFQGSRNPAEGYLIKVDGV
jgi:hypothetical protein